MENRRWQYLENNMLIFKFCSCTLSLDVHIFLDFSTWVLLKYYYQGVSGRGEGRMTPDGDFGDMMMHFFEGGSKNYNGY